MVKEIIGEGIVFDIDAMLTLDVVAEDININETVVENL